MDRQTGSKFLLMLRVVLFSTCLRVFKFINIQNGTVAYSSEFFLQEFKFHMFFTTSTRF